jgi:hypothetical protein
MSLLRRFAPLVVLTLAAAPLLAATPASAAPAVGLLRIAVLSPNAGPLNVTLDGKSALSAAPFTTVAPYRSVTAGTHTIVVTTPGSATPDTTETFTVPAGQDYSAFVLGTASALTVSVIHDLVTTPAKGTATVRLLHAAPGVPAVDVNDLETHARLFTDIAYDRPSGYQSVPGGSYDITMAKAGTAQVLWTVRGVAVKAGSAYTLAAVGGAGRALQVLPLVDASGDANAPNGGIDTGLGGGLHNQGLTTAVLEVGALGSLALLCAAGAAVAWRRAA